MNNIDLSSTANKIDGKKEKHTSEFDLFNDVGYLCKATPLIVSSLQRGCDVAQLPNGDILVTEVKVINTQFSWNKQKNKMVRTMH